MSPLRQRMIEDMQVRNFSPHTQANYVQQIYPGFLIQTASRARAVRPNYREEVG